ncbi:hypothetical protein Bca4012_026925 [Brassica carinata]
MFFSLVGSRCRKPRSAPEGDRSGGCGPFLEISRGDEVFVWRVVFVGEEPENLVLQSSSSLWSGESGSPCADPWGLVLVMGLVFSQGKRRWFLSACAQRDRLSVAFLLLRFVSLASFLQRGVTRSVKKTVLGSLIRPRVSFGGSDLDLKSLFPVVPSLMPVLLGGCVSSGSSLGGSAVFGWWLSRLSYSGDAMRCSGNRGNEVNVTLK